MIHVGCPPPKLKPHPGAALPLLLVSKWNLLPMHIQFPPDWTPPQNLSCITHISWSLPGNTASLITQVIEWLGHIGNHRLQTLDFQALIC